MAHPAADAGAVVAAAAASDGGGAVVAGVDGLLMHCAQASRSPSGAP